MYSYLRQPVMLVNPENDDIVSAAELDVFYESVRSSKDRLELSGENHSSTPKGEGDSVLGASTSNNRFPEMVERIFSFLERN